jgi:hypothetical protein
MSIEKGEKVTLDTKPYLDRTAAEKVLLFSSMILVYQKIAYYKKNILYSNEIENLIPLAITDTLICIGDKKDIYDQSEKVAFIYGLLSKLQVEIKRDEVKKLVIKSPEVLSNFDYDEIMEMMTMSVNHNRGNDYLLTKLLPAINTRYEDIGAFIGDYLKSTSFNSASFEEMMLEFGYCKR